MEATNAVDVEKRFNVAEGQQATKSASTDSENRKISHNYHDYAETPISYEIQKMALSSKLEQSFPSKLHYILSDVEQDGQSHIVSWAPHGRCKCI